MPAYMKEHKLKVGPVHNLALYPTAIPISGIGGHMATLRYVIVNVQVEGIPSYYEEQVALVIPNVRTEGASHFRKTHDPSVIPPNEGIWDPDSTGGMATCSVELWGIQECLHTCHDPRIRYRSRHWVPHQYRAKPHWLGWTSLAQRQGHHPGICMADSAHPNPKNAFMKGHHLNVMVQLLYPEDRAKLPVGLYVQWVYTEMKDGSQNVSMVLHNGMGKPMHLTARQLVGHIVAANLVPDAVASPKLETKLAQDGELEPPLTMEQCQELLMKVLEENGSLGKLKGWKEETTPRLSGSWWSFITSSAWRRTRWVVLTPLNTLLNYSLNRISHSKRGSEG